MTGDCQARICGGPGLRCPGLPDLRGWSESRPLSGRADWCDLRGFGVS